MTDRDPQDGAHEFDELEPLPEDAELHELPDESKTLEPLPSETADRPPAVGAPPEKTTSPAAAVPATPGMVKASTGSRRERMEKDRADRKSKKKSHGWERWPGPGEKPRREMEKAPLILRKAAWWLLIGSVFPWGGLGDKWHFVLLEKLLIAAGLYLWHQAHLLRDGAPVPGIVQKLGAKSFKPLLITAGLLVLIGFAPIASWGDHTAIAEKGFLILAGLTYTHIYDYEHGGRFNPMYPIMFLAPGLGGLFALVKIFSESPSIRIQEILAGVGAALVSIAGWMAAYTMYVALKEAKAEGDRKKALAVEARKTARSSREK